MIGITTANTNDVNTVHGQLKILQWKRKVMLEKVLGPHPLLRVDAMNMQT